jgi:hypothetical protein
MNILKGLPIATHLRLVCKFIKFLYGLKQSLCAWYQCLDHYLTLQGFTRLEFDANIYIKREKDEGFTIFIIYVDDCIIANIEITLMFKKLKIFYNMNLTYLMKVKYITHLVMPSQEIDKWDGPFYISKILNI